MALKLPDRWIWDSWYVWDGDTCHAFYLCASRGLVDPERRHRYTNIGHAISKDLENWQVLPDALSPSDEPAFDSWTTWTGSTVLGDDGVWRMFYTGTSRETEGRIQRVGVAKSNDLSNWSKDTSFVLEADSRWYETLGQSAWPDEAWRDPWVYKSKEDGVWHMLVTARAKDGDLNQRGVVGHATSSDLESWEVQEPLSKPGQGFGQLEVLQYVEVDGVPLVVFCCGVNELSDDIRNAHGDITATFSVPVEAGVPWEFSEARPFEPLEIYAGRLIQRPTGEWVVLGFINERDGEFVGEICSPIAVSANAEIGLIRIA